MIYYLDCPCGATFISTTRQRRWCLACKKAGRHKLTMRESLQQRGLIDNITFTPKFTYLRKLPSTRLLLSIPKARIAELRRMPYQEYLQSPEWQAQRKRILRWAQRRCEQCGATGKQVDIHHKTYERRGCELLSDLMALCRDCHAAIHGKTAQSTFSTRLI